MVDQPLVSVILPVFNAEKFIFAAVKSILDQTYQNIELIIIDDCSTDKSFEILQSFQDSRIRLFRNDKNLKLIATLNKAIQIAQGSFIARMDADDVSMVDRIEKQIKFFQTHPNVFVLGSQIRFINEFGQVKGKPFLCVTGSERIKWRFHFGNCLNHPTIVFKREVVDRAEFYNPEYPHAEDFELWLRLSRKYDFDNLPEPLLLYRIHGASVSQQFSEMQIRSTCRALAEHLKIKYGKVYPEKLLQAVVFPRLKRLVSGDDISSYFREFYPKNLDSWGIYFFLRLKETFFRFLS